MPTFSKIIEFLTYTAIVFAAIEVYLKINKIWKRKHDKEVAESQSIIGLSLAAFVMIIWSLNFIVKGDFEAIADNFIYLFESIILIIIGSGMFVQAKRVTRKSFWELIKESIKLERKEANYLLKTLSGRQTAEKILKILQMLAFIDDDLHPKEKALILEFAGTVGIKLDNKLENPHHPDEPKSARYDRVSTLLDEYLEEGPRVEEIKAFQELLQKLINADDEVTEEEDLMMGILNSQILEKGLHQDVPMFQVIVVPQDNSHIKLIESILSQISPGTDPKSREKHIDGGFGFIVAECRTQAFAELKAEEQRQNHQLMTIVKMVKKTQTQ
jgi:hypothetical protein